GRKIKDMDGYAVGGRSFDTMTLILTFAATYVGSGTTLGSARHVFTNGIIMLVAGFAANVVAYLFMAGLIGPKMERFEGCLTMGEVVGRLFGEGSRMASGIIGLLSTFFYGASQTLALGYIFESLLGIERITGIAVGGTIVAIYAAVGGIKSVVITDVIQFGVLIIMVPLIANVATKKADSVLALLNSVPAEKFAILHHEKFNEYFVMFLIWGGLFPNLVSSPPAMQRMLMARDKQQISSMFLVTIPIKFVVLLAIMLISFFALKTDIPISANTVLLQMVNEILPIGLKGLAIAGLLAVIMSSSDSYFNAAGLLLTHDVIKPICDRKNKVVNELKLARWMTFFIGIIPIFLAALSTDIIKLTYYGATILGLGVSIPLAAGILGMKTDAPSFFIALVVGVLTFIGAEVYLEAELQYLAPLFGNIANGVAFFGAHIIQNNGFKIVKLEEGGETSSSIDWLALRRRIAKSLQPKQLLLHSRQKMIQFGASPTLFAAFCCLSYVVPIFMWTSADPPFYIPMFIMRLIGGAVCIFLMAKNYWPERLKPYFPIYWYLSLLYCLPLSTTVMFMMMGSSEWLINIALSIMMLVLLVDWLSFVLIAVGGIWIGFFLHKFLVYKNFIEATPLEDPLTIYLLVYVCVFTTLIGLLFARQREKTIEAEKRTTQLYAANIAHDLDNTIGCVKLFSSGLEIMLKTAPIKENPEEESYTVPKTVYEFIEDLPRQLSQESDRGYEVIKVMLEAVKRGGMIDPRQLEETSLRECVVNALQRYHMEEEQRKNITLKEGEDFTVLVEKKAFWHVFYNLLKNA
ncbi:MAG: hypothetical protein MI674_03140, partial [Cytophagales bacterium]|nr:hypothetical protein [Cytophagales bacterium]